MKLTIYVVTMLFGLTASADHELGSKEPINCVGALQGYAYTWDFSPDNRDEYSAWAKRDNPNYFYEFQHDDDNAYYCKNVGTGLPLGAFDHDWKSQGEGGGAKRLTNVVLFTGDACDVIP